MRRAVPLERWAHGLDGGRGLSEVEVAARRERYGANVVVAGVDRDAIRGWCRRIEDGPFSSVSVGERIAFPSHELVTTLAFAAAATERVRILPTVGVLPTHETVRRAVGGP